MSDVVKKINAILNEDKTWESIMNEFIYPEASYQGTTKKEMKIVFDKLKKKMENAGYSDLGDKLEKWHTLGYRKDKKEIIKTDWFKDMNKFFDEII